MPYVAKRPALDPCPVEAVVAIMGAKWKARVLLVLAARPATFGRLRRALPGITQQVLSTQLQSLERDGIVSRSPAGARSTDGTLYALTAEGRSLLPVLDHMAEWGLARLHRQGLEWTRPSSLPILHSRSGRLASTPI